MAGLVGFYLRACACVDTMPADSSQPSVEARRHATPARCAITRLRLLAVVVFLVCVVGVARLVTHSTKVGPAVRAHRFHVAQSGGADFAGDGDALVGAGSIRAAPSPNSVVQAARAEAARILEQARTEEAQLLQQADSLGCDCFEQPPGTQPVDGSPRFVEVACPDGCSGHGRCKDLYCHCDEGWGGTGCWTETPKRLSLGEAISFVLVPTRADECVANAMRALHRAFPTVPQVVVARHAKQVAHEVPHALSIVDGTLSKKIFVGLDRVKASYAVVLHSDTVLSPFTDLRQVVREMDNTDVVMMGGSVVYGGNETVFTPHTAQVTLPCWAMKTANYTLAYAHGSRTRQRGAMVCDRVSPAFVVRVPTITKVMKLRQDTSGEAVLVDMFLRAKQGGFTVATTPTLQFIRAPYCVQPEVDDDTLAGQMQVVAKEVVPLAEVHFPDERRQPVWPCRGGSTHGKGNKANNPCKMKNLQEALFLVNDFLEEKEYAFAISGGATLSALKLQSLVPWEYDLDVDVWGTASEFELFTRKHLLDFCDESGFSWSFRRAGAAAVVLALTRKGVDVDLYFTILDKPSTFDGDFVPSFDYDLLAIDPWPAPGIHWRNILKSPGPNETVFVETPTAQTVIDGQWVRTRAYDWPFIAKKYGTEACLFHVTRQMASVNDMMDGGYGTKALTRTSRYCPTPGSRSNARDQYGYRRRPTPPPASKDPRFVALEEGCLDGWVWKQDWRDWPTAFPPPAPPPKLPAPRTWFRGPSLHLPTTLGGWLLWILLLCCCGMLTGAGCTMLADKCLGEDDDYDSEDSHDFRLRAQRDRARRASRSVRSSRRRRRDDEPHGNVGRRSSHRDRRRDDDYYEDTSRPHRDVPRSSRRSSRRTTRRHADEYARRPEPVYSDGSEDSPPSDVEANYDYGGQLHSGIALPRGAPTGPSVAGLAHHTSSRRAYDAAVPRRADPPRRSRRQSGGSRRSRRSRRRHYEDT